MADFNPTSDGDSGDMGEDYKAVRLIVGGVVQGVGFRWYVKRVADDYGIKGYVRNLYDGSVETVAEGDSSAIHGFLDEVKTGPSSARVTGVNIEWLKYEGKYKHFDIHL